ncbi:MAG: alcohol dehydrogenase [Alphaproteobacteria bacterium]|nr:alcohol dehydrogenase [Alphaproteobacteria bacterium]
MKAYQFDEHGGPITAHEQETPTPLGSQVLMKVGACGVCHSDVHLWEGYFGLGGDRRLDTRASQKALPFTLGHEIVGEVVALGELAKGVAVGDRRVVYPWIGCGECPTCQRGDEQLCNRPAALGVNVDGGYADHVLVPHPRYLHDYGDASPAVACTYACSGLTAFGALKKVQDRAEGSFLLIVGAGGVGLAGVMIAQAIMDTEIIVADIDPAKLEAAKAAGASHLIDSREPDAGKQVVKLTRGGPLAVVDFVGNEASAKFATGCVGKGGLAVMVGLMGGELRMALPMLPLKNMGIQGSYTGRPDEMAELMALVREGKVKPMPVAERPLADVAQMVEDLRDGKIVGRVVVTP